jgi:hypothetical protein
MLGRHLSRPTQFQKVASAPSEDRSKAVAVPLASISVASNSDGADIPSFLLTLSQETQSDSPRIQVDERLQKCEAAFSWQRLTVNAVIAQVGIGTAASPTILD